VGATPESERLKKLSEDNKTLYKKNEKFMKEIKTYRDDNKKLYEMNKRYVDENVKYQILLKENDAIDEILLRLLKGHPNASLAKLYNELINQNDILLNFENENLRYDKVIEHLEKEYAFLTSDKVKRNPEIEKKLLNEIDRLKAITLANEKKMKECRGYITNLDNEIRKQEDKSKESYGNDFGKTTKEGNIFKANYNKSDLNDTGEYGSLKKSVKRTMNKQQVENNMTIYDELESSYGNIRCNFPVNPRDINFEIESSVEFNDNQYIPPSTSLYKKTYNAPFNK
jgi:hypothetical protein